MSLSKNPLEVIQIDLHLYAVRLKNNYHKKNQKTLITTSFVLVKSPSNICSTRD